MLQRRAGPGRDQRVAELVADQGLTVAGARRLDGPERPSIRSSSAPITPTLSGTRYARPTFGQHDPMASAAGLNLDDAKTEQSFDTAWMARRPSDPSVEIGGSARG